MNFDLKMNEIGTFLLAFLIQLLDYSFLYFLYLFVVIMNFSSSSSDEDSSEEGQARFQLKSLKARLDGIERELRIEPAPAPDQNTTQRRRYRRGNIDPQDTHSINKLVQRYKKADQRRQSVVIEKQRCNDTDSKARRKERLSDVCHSYAIKRFLHFTSPTLLVDVQAANMGGKPLDTRSTLGDPQNVHTCLRARLTSRQNRITRTGNTMDQDAHIHKMRNKFGGVHAGSNEIGCLVYLTSMGYLQRWSPCAIETVTRLNDPFRKERQVDTSPNTLNNDVNHIDVKGYSFQGFAEIDSNLDWSSEERRTERRERRRERRREQREQSGQSTSSSKNSGKEHDSEDSAASSDASSSSSSSGSDSDLEWEDVNRDVLLTGCFVGPGAPWWKSQDQNTSSSFSSSSFSSAPETTASPNTSFKEPDSMIGIMHHVFIVGAKKGRVSLHRCIIRRRKRRDGNGMDAPANSSRRHHLPTSGLDMDDLQSIECTKVVSRRFNEGELSIKRLTNGQFLTSCADLSSRGMIICGGGATVLGLSLHGDLATLFFVDLAIPPALDVDQATACSMIVWRSQKDEMTNNDERTNSTREDNAGLKNRRKIHIDVQKIVADNATGLVLACTSNGHVIKLCLKSTSVMPTRKAYTGISIEANEIEAKKTIKYVAWCTLVCDKVNAPQLSFMSTTSSTSTSSTLDIKGKVSSWSSFISCNGMGFGDPHDVTVCVGDDTIGVRLLILSQTNTSTSGVEKNGDNSSYNQEEIVLTSAERKKDEKKSEKIRLSKESGPASVTRKKGGKRKINSKRKTTMGNKKNSSNTGSRNTSVANKQQQQHHHNNSKRSAEGKVSEGKVSDRDDIIITDIEQSEISNNSSNSNSSKGKKADARRNVTLHPQHHWLPENFASDGVARVDAIVLYENIWQSMVDVGVVYDSSRRGVAWKASCVSPDGKMMILLCCCPSVRRSQEGTQKEFAQHSNMIIIAWDVKLNRLLSTYNLPATDLGASHSTDSSSHVAVEVEVEVEREVEGKTGSSTAFPNHNATTATSVWNMTYDLRDLKHLQRKVFGMTSASKTDSSTHDRSTTTCTTENSDQVSVDVTPYYRAPMHRRAMSKLLMEKTMHIVTLMTPDRWCQFDVTVPYKQLVSMRRRHEHNERDITLDYLLPLLSSRVKKKTNKNNNNNNGSMHSGNNIHVVKSDEEMVMKKKGVFSKVKMFSMLGGNNER